MRAPAMATLVHKMFDAQSGNWTLGIGLSRIGTGNSLGAGSAGDYIDFDNIVLEPGTYTATGWFTAKSFSTQTGYATLSLNGSSVGTFSWTGDGGSAPINQQSQIAGITVSDVNNTWRITATTTGGDTVTRLQFLILQRTGV